MNELKNLEEKLSEMNDQYKRQLDLKKKRERISEAVSQNRIAIKENRKERTRRLIEKGALLEKYFDSYHLDVEQTEELLKMFSSFVNKNKPDSLKKK